MTEKEKNHVAFILTKNIRQAEKYKNYAVFFDKEKALESKKENVIDDAKNKIDMNNKQNTKNEKRDTYNIENNEKKMIAEVSKENENKTVSKKEKIKEMFKTIGKTQKKSKKVPRIVIEDNKTELSRNMNIKIALEDLYDKVIDKIYNKKEFEIEIKEEYFYYFLQIQKFYKLLILIFDNFEAEKLKPFMFFIAKYCVKIKFYKEFEDFVIKSYTKFPIIENIEESYFFNNFYFSVCNLILGKHLLLCNSFFLPFFVKYLCDENLELVFVLEKDLIAWEFLAVFVKKVDDVQKSVIVTLVKDRVLETMENKNEEALQGLNVFLNAIGLEMEDLE